MTTYVFFSSRKVGFLSPPTTMLPDFYIHLNELLSIMITNLISSDDISENENHCNIKKGWKLTSKH